MEKLRNLDLCFDKISSSTAYLYRQCCMFLCMFVGVYVICVYVFMYVCMYICIYLSIYQWMNV